MADVEGLKEVQIKMEQVARDIQGNIFRGGMAKATLLVQRDAKRNAPVDRGPLRASITPEIISGPTVVQGIVGSNLKYAPYQELGTRPFWPPWRPIYEWALRKVRGNRQAAGALAHRARISIATRGIQAKRFLQRALEDNAEKVYQILGDVVGKIVEK